MGTRSGPGLSRTQFNDLRAHNRAVDRHSGNAKGQLESPGTCASRIQKENSVSIFDTRPMGVTADYRLNLLHRRRHLQVLQIVEHVDGNAGSLHGFDLWNSFGPFVRIVVPSHSNHRSEVSQTVENIGTADIASMKNQGHAFEDSQHLRTQKTVSIRNDSDNLSSSARSQSHASFGIKEVSRL